MIIKLILILLFPIIAFTQEITLSINGFNKKATLQEIQGENLIFVDSLIFINNTISYKNSKLTHGLYRITFAQNKWLNFIYDGKDVALKTDYNNILDSLKIIKSVSNILYYNFLKLNKDYKTKSELLNVILTHYPKDDDYYEITNSKLKIIKSEYAKFVNIESQTNPKSFIARYLKSSQLPIIPENIPQQEQLNYLKNHALDKINFDDAELISSDMFTNKSIEYLTYYRNPQLPKELLEQEFMKAVDTLLNKAKVNVLVYQHITEYLIAGFKKFGFDKIIDYIVENYVVKDDLCLDETLENSIERRIEQSKKLSKGIVVPNIVMPDKDNVVIDLARIKSDKTLLVFYSTDCPHCKELLPKLNKYKSEQKEIEILAISLDSKREEWIKFIDDHKIDLININDPNGWDGDLASQFYIYATPTMFLLDKDKRIIGKPTNYNELFQLF